MDQRFVITWDFMMKQFDASGCCPIGLPLFCASNVV